MPPCRTIASRAADTINPAYVLASFLCPIAWGTHVAAWIQKQNGL
jgi:hypothetical protein